MATNKIDTTLVSAGRSKRYTQGSVNSVIQRASSLVFDTVADKNGRRQVVHRASFFMVAVAPSPTSRCKTP